MNGAGAAPKSLYFATANAAVEAPSLSENLRTSVVVIGGGFTGVSTALHLAEEGVDVVLVEAHMLGWGASGRNGGQVNPGFKAEPEAVEARFGPDVGRRLVSTSMAAPNLVFNLVERYGIACDARRGGSLRAAFDKKYAAGIKSAYEQFKARGADVELLDADRMRMETGTDRYILGMRDSIGGSIHPLNYLLGLANAARAAGARIFCGTPALKIDKGASGWTILTPKGSVQAEKVVVATNAYTGDLVSKLKRTLVPAFSGMVATEPLPAKIAERVMPCRSVLYEKASLTIHCRVDGAGHFLIGGRSQMRDAEGPESFRYLTKYAERLWPVLTKVRWRYGWNGQVAVTADGFPHVHEVDDSIFICLGYNGRGVALGTVVGQVLSRRVRGGAASEMPFPVTPIEPIPFQKFWKLAATARIAYGRTRDSIFNH